jgi:hypothetical protein
MTQLSINLAGTLIFAGILSLRLYANGKLHALQVDKQPDKRKQQLIEVYKMATSFRYLASAGAFFAYFLGSLAVHLLVKSTTVGASFAYLTLPLLAAALIVITVARLIKTKK